MGPVLAESPPGLFDARGKEHREGGEGDGLTLEGLLSGAWEGLSAHAVVACPLCRGDLRPQYGAGAAPVGGRCADCGTSMT